MEASALYLGAVTHQRFAPRRHRLSYRLFQMLLDLDEAPALAARLRWFSFNRPNLVSFHERDHGDGRESGLRGWIEETLAAAGLPWKGGTVRLLCMPRILGHVFNPISLYYCHGPGGELTAMLYEVNNTFGERHSYLIAAAPDSGSLIRQSCPKAFYVSPFMDMDMRYDFRLSLPGASVTTAVRGAGAGRRTPDRGRLQGPPRSDQRRRPDPGSLRLSAPDAQGCGGDPPRSAQAGGQGSAAAPASRAAAPAGDGRLIPDA